MNVRDAARSAFDAYLAARDLDRRQRSQYATPTDPFSEVDPAMVELREALAGSGAWDSLTEQDKNLIITALQTAPSKRETGSSESPLESEYSELVTRLEGKRDLAMESLERALAAVLSDVNASVAEVSTKALFETLDSLKGLNGGLVKVIAGLLRLVEGYVGGVRPDDPDVMDAMDQARAGILMWQDTEVAINDLLHSIRTAG